MRLRFVWGICPYIIREKDVPGTGRTYGPVVLLDPDADDATRVHEIVHVKQFYAMGAAIATSGMLGAFVHPLLIFPIALLVVWRLSRQAVFRLETAAYAAGAIHHVNHDGWNREEALNSAARTFDQSDLYKENASFSEIRAQISKRMDDGRIF